MKLWLIEQDENNRYDTYDSAVVAAETEEDARRQHPNGSTYDESLHRVLRWDYEFSSWARTLARVKVTLLGEAVPGTEAGVICASFNAG